MFRLYWKIFLGFWLTGFLLATFAIVVNQQLSRDQVSEIAGLNPSEIANRTAFILRRLPNESLDWQQSLADYGIALYTRTDRSSSLSDIAVPSQIEPVFKLLESQQRFERSGLTRSQIGMRIESINAETVFFVLDMPSLAVFLLRDLAAQVTAQFLLAMIISAIACWVLARYLTRNLAKISSATHRLAAGHLETRIDIEQSFYKDELDALALDFNDMAIALETSMKNQRRLVRDISHELRSPLARLQLALELARQSGSEEQLDRIEQEASRLNDMIGQLLAMPDESMPLEDCIDLSELIGEITQQSTIEADSRGIQFQLTLPRDEALVAANATQLHSAVENIIRNAIRYSRPNSTIEIELSETPQASSLHTDLVALDNGLDTALDGTNAKNSHRDSSLAYYLYIKDRGPGIPEEDLPHIFKPFYRVDPARNRKTGGYGIGLAIVHKVITAHRGAVKAANWEEGLIMCIALPAFKSQQP